MSYCWIGLKDLAGDDMYRSVGSGTALPASSDAWSGSNPYHGTRNCVYSYGYENPPRLHDVECTSDFDGYICEKY